MIEVFIYGFLRFVPLVFLWYISDIRRLFWQASGRSSVDIVPPTLTKLYVGDRYFNEPALSLFHLNNRQRQNIN
jgi:hypothetical protein